MPHSPTYRRILHRMGYYDYQQGLIYRHINQDKGWESHLSHCRTFILKAVETVKPERVTVLGSGWLMELPISELSERTREIILIDIVHPPDVIEQTRKLKNVKLVEDDVSGGLIQDTWDSASGCHIFRVHISPDDLDIQEYSLPSDPGLLISLNILTQIETLPERFLRKKTSLSEDDYSAINEKIQEKHVSMLKKHRSVLISDVVEILRDSNGSQTEKNTLRTLLPEGTMSDEWIWDFDLSGYDYNRKRSVMKVRAILF